MYTAACRDEDEVIRNLVEDRSLVCRPVSIISFNSGCGSEAAHAVEAQPQDPRCDAAFDGDIEHYHLSSGLTTNTGVTEVVAMAEVGGTFWYPYLDVF